MRNFIKQFFPDSREQKPLQSDEPVKEEVIEIKKEYPTERPLFTFRCPHNFMMGTGWVLYP
ncbi:MAG TPA: hypothetical protein VL576_02010 [Candidatus Paceibacterota bacterium]|jgi:hypothetical protein|nr:hypothetical protein [Candidatus Paceibacterota bacterium]